MPISVIPPEWTNKIDTDEFSDRFKEKVAFKLRSRKVDIQRAAKGRFTVTVRQDPTIQIKIKSRDKKSFKRDYDGDMKNVDAAVKEAIDKIINEVITESFEELVGELSSGL